MYLINNKPVALNTLLVVSEASEHEDGSGRKTSKLRHFIEDLGASQFTRVERIDHAVFKFYNKFWVSFYIGREVFDKQFTIEPFQEWELDDVEELEMEGKEAK